MLCLYIFILLQIFVESFPISSSGHTTLFLSTASYIGCFLPEVVYASWFNHLLHVPAVIIVLFFFVRQWLPFICHPVRYKKIVYRLVQMVVIADSITTLFYGIFKILGVCWFPLGAGFLITAGLLFSLRFCSSTTKKYSLVSLSVLLGIAQGIALLPGISRLGATYVTACWLGIAPRRAFYFSWLLLFPLIVVASLHGLCGLYVYGVSSELLHPRLWLVILGASITAWYGLRVTYYMVITRQLYVWCYYMIVPFMLWLILVAHNCI